MNQHRDVNLKALAQLFFTQRLRAKLTQKEVADYLGVTTETLEGYERAITPIPKLHVYGLSNCLNIEPSKVEECMRHPSPTSESDDED